MPPDPPGDRLHRHPGDGWVACGDHRHWGLLGAAGLFLVRRVRDEAAQKVQAVVLQHRALWSDQGGTWGVPGGALAPGESAIDGALREAREEAGIEPADVRVIDTHVLDHGPWAYTTVIAEIVPGGARDVRATDPESLEVRWVDVADVADLTLLPAFAAVWTELLARAQPGHGRGTLDAHV